MPGVYPLARIPCVYPLALIPSGVRWVGPSWNPIQEEDI